MSTEELVVVDVTGGYPYTHIPSPSKARSRSPSPLRYRDISPKVPEWVSKPTFIRRPPSPVRVMARIHRSRKDEDQSVDTSRISIFSNATSPDVVEDLSAEQDQPESSAARYATCKQRFVQRLVQLKLTDDQSIRDVLKTFEFEEWIRSDILKDFQLND